MRARGRSVEGGARGSAACRRTHGGMRDTHRSVARNAGHYLASPRLPGCPTGTEAGSHLRGVHDRGAGHTLANRAAGHARPATPGRAMTVLQSARSDAGPKLHASSPKGDMLRVMRRLIGIGPLFGLLFALVVSGCGASAVSTAREAGTSTASGRLASSTSSEGYLVRAGSMEPTLPLGARVVVKEGVRPTVGAIVVVHPPEGSAAEECGPKPHMVKPDGRACEAPIPEESKIKLVERIVGGPGDEIHIREGHVYRKPNGSRMFVRESDSYTRGCGTQAGCNFPDPITIPSGHWFLMGDNRGESDDSRFWGPVPTAWIVGMVTQVHRPAF